MLNIAPDAASQIRLNALKKLDRKFRKATRDTLREVYPYIKNRAGELMDEPKTGRIYQVYVSRAGRRLRRGRRHQASSKTEPFARMSGATLRSLRRIVPRWDRMEVGFGTPQSAWEKTDRAVLKRILYSEAFELHLKRTHIHNMKRELNQ